MKDAHQGVPPAGLPLGDWRSPDGSPPEPPAPAFPDASSGAPMALHRGGAASAASMPATAPSAQPAPQAPAAPPPPPPTRRAGPSPGDNGLLPPANIPNAGADGGLSPRDKTLLDKLLGTR